MENAEVLEMTVQHVESILQNTARGESRLGVHAQLGEADHSLEMDQLGSEALHVPVFPPAADSVNREASERFAAGYIQCMHEVHTFVSSCPGIDATIAADLLNHLLECMPLNDEDRVQDLLSDLLGDRGTGPGEGVYPVLSPREGSATGRASDVQLSPSSTSGDDLSSDTDETDTEPSRRDAPDHLPTVFHSKSMWRPW